MGLRSEMEPAKMVSIVDELGEITVSTSLKGTGREGHTWHSQRNYGRDSLYNFH
jgi:hypothetical protein